MPKLPKEPRSSEVTPEPQYLRRRELLRNAALFAGTVGAVGGGLQLLAGGRTPAAGRQVPLPELMTQEVLADASPASGADAGQAAGRRPPTTYRVDEAQNSYEEITRYNNFYEFGLDKSDPARNAHSLRPRPWTVAIEGEVHRPGRYDIETILKWAPLEERIYRFRCVEAWSMVVPWLGFSLASLVKRAEPTSRARYVAFETLHDQEQMPGQRRPVLDWPYVEGLRLDEALHPLAMMVTGLYGRVLPNQNGAPLRLMIPWKYGFKSIKSIVRVRFTADQPPTTWNQAAANEYGFYANVNPSVDHPRWSQATERRVGEIGRRKTLLFNGYADAVGQLYSGMDLTRSF